MPRVRFAPEGWLFVIPVIIFAGIALLMQWYAVAIVLGGLAAFLLSFFRDPHRAGSERHVDVLSPADGTIVEIKDIPDGEVWPGLTRQISVLMSVFDVHVNRAPISGRIVHYRYDGGQQNLIVITDARGVTVAIRQIAGLLARRIVFDKKEGDEVGRGERIGMIKFGSRVDAFFPPEATLKVQMRDKVKVALTVIAEIGP
jgi:phosphatidylserine decarboxylase